MKRFTNILVSVNSRLDDQPALQWARLLAEHNRAKLTLVDVQHEASWLERLLLRDYEYVEKLDTEKRHERLDAFAQPIRDRGIEVATKVLSGSTSIEIIREVLRAKHDLVVRVSRGKNSRRAGFFGSTTMRLLRQCPCPVWAVKPDAAPRFQCVLAAIDPVPDDANHTQLNSAIMALSKSISELGNGQYLVVHAWSLFAEGMLTSQLNEEELEKQVILSQRQVETAFDKFLAWYGLSAKSKNVYLLKGDPEIIIPRFAAEQQVDLIVMGTVARTGIPGMIMGNTAEVLLDSIHCSVLALKPDAFVSPVSQSTTP